MHAKTVRVSKKMLWDRFRMWRVPRKYNAKQVGSSRPASTLVTNPQTAMITSPERRPFFAAMTNVGNWFQSVVDAGTWRVAARERRIDMQRLVSRAHMAIESQSYDTKARLHELHGIEDQSRELMAGMGDAKMHPRVLTALMRLWISDWQSDNLKGQWLQAVKGMVCRTSQKLLQASHPVATLSRLVSSHHHPDEVMSAYFEQFQKRLIVHIMDEDPDFAVREQIYGARVLASVGRPGKAAELLQQTDVRREVDNHTVADFYSTRGYVLLQDDHHQDAIQDLSTAIDTFESIDEAHSEGAEYAHFCLAMCYEAIGTLDQQERHLEAALSAWESNAALQKNQGGIKIVLDLHKVYEKQGKQEKMQELRERYCTYFEEVPEGPS